MMRIDLPGQPRDALLYGSLRMEINYNEALSEHHAALQFLLLMRFIEAGSAGQTNH